MFHEVQIVHKIYLMTKIKMVSELFEIYGLKIVEDNDVEELRMPRSLIEFLSKCSEKDMEYE